MSVESQQSRARRRGGATPASTDSKDQKARPKSYQYSDTDQCTRKVMIQFGPCSPIKVQASCRPLIVLSHARCRAASTNNFPPTASVQKAQVGQETNPFHSAIRQHGGDVKRPFKQASLISRTMPHI